MNTCKVRKGSRVKVCKIIIAENATIDDEYHRMVGGEYVVDDIVFGENRLHPVVILDCLGNTRYFKPAELELLSDTGSIHYNILK